MNYRSKSDEFGNVYVSVITKLVHHCRQLSQVNYRFNMDLEFLTTFRIYEKKLVELGREENRLTFHFMA